MTKKNILIVFSDLNNGGAQVQMLNVLENIKDDRFSFYICCLKGKGPMAGNYGDKGYPIFFFDMKTRYSIHRLFSLYCLIKNLKISTIITQGGGDSLFWGRLTGYLAGVKQIFSTIHTTGNTIEGKPPVHKLNRYLSFINQYYICVCEYQGQFYQRNYNFKKSKIKIIYNGVSLKRIDASTQTKLKQDVLQGMTSSQIVGIVATLRDYKNHKMFLRAAAETLKHNKDVLFLIIGDGPLMDELENFTRELSIEKNVKFLGYKANAIEYMSIMNIVVLTSITTETFPLSLLEAMSQSKPVIATPVGGIPEMIWPGENGFLVAVNDYMDLSNKLLMILNNYELERKMGEKSLFFCEKNFDIKYTAAQLIKLINSN